MYHRGTLTEFNTWHAAAMASEGIELPDGKTGFVNGQVAPDNQRTTAYSNVCPHPVNADDYVWFYGNYPDDAKTSLSLTEAKTAGWFPKEI